MRRIVSVWSPDWPITVWSRTPGRSSPPEDRPFALIGKNARGLYLHALNPAARALGLWRGQPQADARAAAPELTGAPAEPEREARALLRLAQWAERFSPTVATDRTVSAMEGLLLDATGVPHLFGGEDAMLSELGDRLARAGVPARLAMAETPGAAWAVARFGVEAETVVRPGGVSTALAPLPCAALRLPDPVLRKLSAFGLETVGDLLKMPRAGLARRFRDESGLTVVRRLDQALGEVFEPLTPERTPPRHRVMKVFAEPMTDPMGAAHWLPEMAASLCAAMETDGLGARRIRLAAFRMDGGVSVIEARLSAPSAVPAHLIRLLRERGYERLDLGLGADALALSAVRTEPLVVRQTDLEAKDSAEDAALASLVDRLSARLGEGAVRRPAFRESRLPERAAVWRPADGDFALADPPAPALTGAPRPVLIFEPPEPVEAIAELPDGAPARFVWRRVPRRIVRASGPERAAPEWWRTDTARTRDYYRAEDEAGRRYWLFREGLYGVEDGTRDPVWRLHGLFP